MARRRHSSGRPDGAAAPAGGQRDELRLQPRNLAPLPGAVGGGVGRQAAGLPRVRPARSGRGRG
jgi:hypothetical protein